MVPSQICFRYAMRGTPKRIFFFNSSVSQKLTRLEADIQSLLGKLLKSSPLSENKTTYPEKEANWGKRSWVRGSDYDVIYVSTLEDLKATILSSKIFAKPEMQF